MQRAQAELLGNICIPLPLIFISITLRLSLHHQDFSLSLMSAPEKQQKALLDLNENQHCDKPQLRHRRQEEAICLRAHCRRETVIMANVTCLMFELRALRGDLDSKLMKNGS